MKHLRYSSEFFAPLFDNAEMLEYAKAIAGLQDAFGFINDFHVALSRLHDWEKSEALHIAESVMSRCQPWGTECERRGLSSTHRRMQHDINLQVE